MKIHQGIDELVGGTPLLRLNNIEKQQGLNAALLAKLESFNPTGSAKDRPARAIIEKAEKDGLLKKNSVRRNTKHYQRPTHYHPLIIPGHTHTNTHIYTNDL